MHPCPALSHKIKRNSRYEGASRSKQDKGPKLYQIPLPTNKLPGLPLMGIEREKEGEKARERKQERERKRDGKKERKREGKKERK